MWQTIKFIIYCTHGYTQCDITVQYVLYAMSVYVHEDLYGTTVFFFLLCGYYYFFILSFGLWCRSMFETPTTL
jgi:hypothetical protein